MDGLKLYLEQSSNIVIQNMFYNGWTHDHYVSSVIVLCPDGTIPMVTYNLSGSFHDSTIADWGSMYTKLQHIYEDSGTNGRCVVDSAFCKKKFVPYLIKSSQPDPSIDDPHGFIVNQEAALLRRLAEWLMRALQSSFPRLKDHLIYEELVKERLYPR